MTLLEVSIPELYGEGSDNEFVGESGRPLHEVIPADCHADRGINET